MFAKFSVKKPMSVLVAVVLVLILGYVAFTSMTTDLLPDINLPYVIVMTTYPGASPEAVEEELTRPIEQQMATLDGISSVMSTSAENYSLVMLEFSQETNMDTITGDIREKLNLINGSWDSMVGTPTILKLNPSMLPVAVVAVDRDDTNITDLSTLVNDRLMTQLEGIEGVASVTVSGDVHDSIRVELDPAKIDALNEKIRAAIDGKFADGETQIADGLAQVESGLSQANAAAASLPAAKAQLAQAQIALNEGIAEAQTQAVVNAENEALSVSAGQSVALCRLAFVDSESGLLIPVTRALKDASLETTLAALTDPGEDSALQSAIPDNCSVVSANVSDDTAIIDMSEEFADLSAQEMKTAAKALIYTAMADTDVLDVVIRAGGTALGEDRIGQVLPVALNEAVERLSALETIGTGTGDAIENDAVEDASVRPSQTPRRSPQPTTPLVSPSQSMRPSASPSVSPNRK